METGRPPFRTDLEGLRGIAILLVVLFHAAVPGFGGGFVGVDVFFVLSGYFITRSLDREVEDTGSIDLNVFWGRRMLRLSPSLLIVIAATLGIAFTLYAPIDRQGVAGFARHVSVYAGNVSLASSARDYFSTTDNPLLHTWSLAVEEQFYLVWPFLILFAPKRHLLPLIAIVVAIGPAFRFCGANFLGLGEVALVALPFSSLDTLGLGGLLALLQRQRNTRGLAWLAALSVAGFCTFVLLHLIFGFQDTSGSSLARTALAPALLGVVWLAARGVPGPFGRLVELPPLIYLGRISYGLYVFHNFVPAGTAAVMRKVGVMPLDTLSPALLFALNFAVLLVVSSASWHFYESPMNQLKRLFPYASRSLAPAASLQQARL